jgi:hypothetical protein
MTEYGIDVSEHNAGLDLTTIKKQGYSFVTARCVIGDIVDHNYAEFHAAAKKAGLLFAAYVFPWTAVSPATTAKLMRENIGETDIPIMIDLEIDGTSKPSYAFAKAHYDALRAEGLRPWSIYYPHWYWSETGTPPLTDRGWRLIGSSYGSNPRAYGAAAYASVGGDKSAGWAPYGGRQVSILQFGSRIIITGYPGNIDGDAYRGTLAQLKAEGLFKDYASKPTTAVKESPNMIIIAPDKTLYTDPTKWPGVFVWDGAHKPVHITSHEDHLALRAAIPNRTYTLSLKQWAVISALPVS